MQQTQQILLGYRRKSMVRDQTHLISPERQMKSCELWSELQIEDYAIEWFEDIEGHRSGRYEKGRPGWQALMAQLDRPDVVGVVADSFDRMYRNVHQFLNFLNMLETANKKLITVKEGLDTSSTLGRAIVTILMVIYQLESDQTSDRMAANVKYKREVLGRHWGPTPFGCDRNEKGHLVPTQKIYWLNPRTGEAKSGDEESPGQSWEERRYFDGLLEIYGLYSGDGYSYIAVAEKMNLAGWRYYANAKGNCPRPFTHDSIRRIISFWQLYMGQLPLGNITNTTNPEVVAGGHDPILPVELCELVGQVKRRRGQGKGNPIPGQPQRIYILSDVLYCAVCEKPLKGQYQRGWRSYRHYGGKQNCPEKWVMADEIEAEVIKSLIALSDTDFMDSISAEAERMAQAAFARHDSTRSLLDDLEAQRQRLTRLEDLYLDEAIDKSRYLIRKSAIDQDINSLEDKLFAATQTVNYKQVISRMNATLETIKIAEPKIKKALVNSIFQHLFVGGGQIIRVDPQPWAKPFF